MFHQGLFQRKDTSMISRVYSSFCLVFCCADLKVRGNVQLMDGTVAACTTVYCILSSLVVSKCCIQFQDNVIAL